MASCRVPTSDRSYDTPDPPDNEELNDRMLKTPTRTPALHLLAPERPGASLKHPSCVLTGAHYIQHTRAHSTYKSTYSFLTNVKSNLDIPPCRAPLRGGARSRQTHGPTHDPIKTTPRPPNTALGCGGVPRGGPLPAAPTPPSAHNCRGPGGVGRPALGGAGSRANPSFPPQKIPETGRGRPPRKRPLCTYNTPSTDPLVGYSPAGSRRSRWRHEEGVSPPMS